MEGSTSPQFSVTTNTDTIIAEIRARIEALHQLRLETDNRYEQRFAAQEKAVMAALAAAEKAVVAALAAAEKAVDRAEVTAERWRQSANEWRGAMDDRERRYVMKDSQEAITTAIQKEIGMIQQDLTVMRGKTMGMDKMWGYIIAAIGAAGAVGITVAFVTK